MSRSVGGRMNVDGWIVRDVASLVIRECFLWLCLEVGDRVTGNEGRVEGTAGVLFVCYMGPVLVTYCANSLALWRAQDTEAASCRQDC